MNTDASTTESPASVSPLTSTRAQPALRLVSTKGLSREEWLAYRRQGIGSSDAAAAVGLNPYQSPLELWLVKTGRDDHLPAVDPEDDTSPMFWGTVLEPVVAERYARRTGFKVRRCNAVLQHPNPDKAWMLANIDREVVGHPEVQVLECKTAGEFGARLWRDGVPDYIQCQVQHQLAVTGKQAADVAVLICGQELRIHRIERDEALIASLIELERRFWQYVVTDTPPPVDGSDSSAQALQALYPIDRGETLDLREDPELSATFDSLVAVRVELDARKATEALLKQRIQERMGEASRALFAAGAVSWKKSKAGARRFLIHP
ncbi:YqaJ viral recombinase family nuclease [Noviherbaspirillum sp.]|jgi:putative phage-type endonuclease|uniref:YqaJ viral recombinase family nuclease n=1 Tax=Noviherbaspirillum sp. TaxID=1926288 RepID=UPI002FE102AC